MKKMALLGLCMVAVITLFFGCEAKEYPERDITGIVPFGQGGGTDTWARKVMAGMATELGVNINVSNVTGGSAGSIGIAQAYDAKHDGYTLAGTSETPLTIPVMTPFEKTSKDWEYFIAAGSPGYLCMNVKVANDLGIATLDDLASYADKESLNIAGTSGGLWFALSSLLTEEAYGDWGFQWVSYDGSGSAILGTVGGTDAQLVVASAGEVQDYIRSGDLVAIANMDKVNSDFEGTRVTAITTVLPELAKHFPLRQWLGIKVPSDTPEDVLTTLTDAFNKVMDSAEIQQFATSQAAEVFALSGSAAKEMAAKSESSLCWLLYELGKTVNSPADVGIAKP